MSLVKNITAVKGFKCWGAYTGVKSMRRDLGIIKSEVPANASAVFTQNKVVAEPIKVSREHIKDGKAQIVVINSGNANACTGRQGAEAAQAMVQATSEVFGIDPGLVIIASTGIIGKKFPTKEVVEGIKETAGKLSNDSKAGVLLANAILTTDTFAKEGHLSFEIDGKEINMAGIAKGSGMIHPNMATMLGFITTDAAIEQSLLDKAFREATGDSFNMISVDGDTSTNDMALILANGMAENKEITSEKSEAYKIFSSKLKELCIYLAKLIVSDGEGASKMIEYQVLNAPDKATAQKIIRTISDSSLVKTAMFGRDPNWGRIIAAAGRAGVPFDHEIIDLQLGALDQMLDLIKDGQPLEVEQALAKKVLRESQLKVILDMKMGTANATGWGADLTTDYVLFNATYST